MNRNIDLASDRQSSIRLHNSAHNSRLVSEVLPPTGNIVHDSQNRIYDGTPYEIWTKDEYEVIIYIDNREIRAQQERDFSEDSLNLPILNVTLKP